MNEPKPCPTCDRYQCPDNTYRDIPLKPEVILADIACSLARIAKALEDKT